ncbi:PPE domain-containing protein [Lentzea nigeriaca]|uniref:PPE domain-containing protein n=1 Tax=Lentzea nigeriaca TaxID=1128665 RepID=UPI00195ED718|nr:PPE domain-containing protein [Lentzea nigeriaca]MBM7860739.1 hypothetical protein [Lentzea nigeriaca]
MLGNYNFDAKSHQELYDKIHANDGASFAQAVEDAWNGFRAVMGNAKAEIEAAYREAGVDWVGTAGEAFSGAMAPLAQFAEDARAAGVETHHSVQAQQSFYHGAKNGMPPPVKVSSTANDDFFGIPAGMTHLVGGQTDQDIEEQKANEAKREAVRVMKTYETGAVSSVTSIGTFVPPPQVTAQVAETPIQQPSNSQTQYSEQWSSQQRTTSTSDQVTPPQQQQQNVTAPPVLHGHDDTTGTSNYQPPADTVPRPTPQPVPPPGLQPTPNPQPPIGGPLPPTMRPPQGSTPVGGTNSRGTSGVGTPRLGSGVVGQQPGQLGRGPAAGVGAFGEAAQTGRGGQGAAGARGAAGTPGMGMAGAPQRGQGEEDKEHKSAPYLEELDDVWGEGTIPMVAPPVIGETEQ